MAKTTVHGKDVRTYIDGAVLTGDAMESSWARSIDTAKRPRRGEDRVGYLSGHEGGKWTVGGYMARDQAVGLEYQLRGLPEDTAVILEQFGDSGRGKFGTVRTAGLDLGTPAEDKASIKGDLQVTGGIRACDMLLASVVIADDSEESSALDGGAASALGGSACLAIYGYTQTGSLAVKLQHSTTGTGEWADLVSFSAHIGVGAEIVEIDAASIRRYVRAVATLTGRNAHAGQVSIAVGFERR